MRGANMPIRHARCWQRRLAVAAVAALVGCASIRSQAPSAEDVRDRLTREYALIEDGFRHNDPSPWVERLGPCFRLMSLNGPSLPRQSAIDLVRRSARASRVEDLSIEVLSVQFVRDEWVATVRHTSARTFPDSLGAPRVELGVIQLETWSPASGTSWQLVSIQESQLLYLRRNGTSARQARPD
jgi:hypothetical protein